MPDFAELLEKAKQTGEGRIAAGHLAVQMDTLNKLYDNEPTRDAAYILATDWIENGSPLRKAAAAAWAKEKHVPVGDQPDPNATVPTPNDLSNGIDAPDSGDGAAGAGPAANKVADDKKKDEKHHHPAPKGKGDVISRLKALAARRKVPAAHGTHDSTAAAYEAGYRDATKKHADAAHRIGTLAAHHAFKLGAEAGHNMGAQAQQAAGNGMMTAPGQMAITHPGMSKSDRVNGLMALAKGASNDPGQANIKTNGIAGAFAGGVAGHLIGRRFGRPLVGLALGAGLGNGLGRYAAAKKNKRMRVQSPRSKTLAQLAGG
jgi:hypothetical protein